MAHGVPTMTTKLKWRVDPKPTGQYRSFHRRGWPTADVGEHTVARVSADQEYIPSNVKRGIHGLITVHLLIRTPTTKPRWVRLKERAMSLTVAKELAQDWFNRNPQYLPPKGKAND